MKIIAAICLAIALFAGLAEAGAGKHWLCMNCHKRVFKESRPSLSGCPKGGTHAWVVDY